MLDLLPVVLFVAWSVASGFRSRKIASRGLDEYFLAGRTLPGWKAGFSMAATQFAADTPLLVAGLVATGGVFLLWRLWIYALAFLLMAFVFAEGWRRAGVLTDAELTRVRYSGRGVPALRLLKAVYYGTVVNVTVLAMVMVAAVRIAEVFLPWHAWLPGGVYAPVLALVRWSGVVVGGLGAADPTVATADNLISVVLILGFTALYSTTGGLRSVVATDVVQFSIAIAGTAIYAYYVAEAVGGLGALGQRLADLYGAAAATRMTSFAPPPGETLGPFLAIVGLQWLFQMNADGTGYLAQRSMACATDRDATSAGVVFAWMQILGRSLVWLVIAVGLLVLYPYAPAAAAGDGFAASREILFVRGIDDLLPPGVRGVMLTALLAALASTVDTHLNWGASYWSNDVWADLVCRRLRRREPGSRELVVVARLSAIAIVGLALVVMANLGSIQEAWSLSLLFGAGAGGVLVLRWTWERINLASEAAAMIVGLLAAPFLLLVDAEWIRLVAMAALSTGAAVVAAFWGPRTEPGTLAAFYRTVRPSGAWPETARACGEDPREPRRRLLRGIGSAALHAGAIFALLVGIGRWLVPGPETSGGWTAAWIVAGAALTAAAARRRRPGTGSTPLPTP